MWRGGIEGKEGVFLWVWGGVGVIRVIRVGGLGGVGIFEGYGSEYLD